MSELQLSLLAIGAVVIIAVVVYNKWQEAQYRKSAERSFEVKHEDALLEPAVPRAAVATKGQADEDLPAGRREPYLGGRPAAAVDDTVPRKVSATQSVESEQGPSIDHVLRFESGHQFDSTRLIELAVVELAEFSKPVRLEGRDESTGSWVPVGHGGAFSDVRAGIQLVDRQGSIAAEELARFDLACARMAASLNVKVEADSRPDSIQRAAELNQFCESVDVQIAMNLVADSPFEASRLYALADASGLALEEDGKFYRRDAEGHVLFTMSGVQGSPLQREEAGNLTIPAVMLELDVPRTSPGLGAFDALQAFAEDVSESMSARIMDDNRVVIEEAARTVLRSQLDRMYSEMSGFGIPAGSSVAFRLFS